MKTTVFNRCKKEHINYMVWNHQSIEKILKNTYALLPVWFLTINYNNKKYTMMVNGQTGKFIGTPPVSKKKKILTRLILTPIVALLFTLICYCLFDSHYGPRIGIFNIFAPIFLIGAAIYKDDYKKDLSLTTETNLLNYANKRQKRKQ